VNGREGGDSTIVRDAARKFEQASGVEPGQAPAMPEPVPEAVRRDRTRTITHTQIDANFSSSTKQGGFAMQKAPSQVSSGNIAPAIVGPSKDKDVFVISGLVVSLAAVLGAFWYYSTDRTPAVTQDRLTGSKVTEALKSNSDPVITPVSLPAKIEVHSIPQAKPGIVHTDFYFEIGRKGLTDEAKTLLQEQAVLLKNDGNLGVLVQGYTDQQGSAGYNLKLGMKRAETVKSELINAGVAEHQIKIVSLGKEGVLCNDNSDVCRQMNRRVHLEIRTIGQEHMVPPVIATTPAADPVQTVSDPSQKNDDSGSLLDGILPPANASEGNDQTPAPLEPASGS
jgi:peptidoglycan-associated lipoprotein